MGGIVGAPHSGAGHSGGWRLAVGATMGAVLATLGGTLCGTVAGLTAMSSIGVAVATLAGGAGLGALGVLLALMMPGPHPPNDSSLERVAAAVERLARGRGLEVDPAVVPEELRGALAFLNDALHEERTRAARLDADLRERNDREGAHARRLRARIDSLEAQNAAAIRVRDAFLARMSHELRTPLNAILGYLEMIEEDVEDDDIREDVSRVRSSARGLLAIVTTVLDLTQLEAGSFEVIPEAIDLVALAQQVHASVEGEARANHNRLDLSIPPGLDVHLDRRMVQSILYNLASNACKYTNDGRVQIRIAQTGDRVHITVSDTGIGMTPRQIEEAYRPFGQADVSSTRRYDGAGLGLAVVRGFAEAMGGTIRIASELGKGAEVVVDLPRVCEAKVSGLDEEEPTMLLR